MQVHGLTLALWDLALWDLSPGAGIRLQENNLGVKKELFDNITAQAVDHLMVQSNPRPVSGEDVIEILVTAWKCWPRTGE